MWTVRHVTISRESEMLYTRRGRTFGKHSQSISVCIYTRKKPGVYALVNNVLCNVLGRRGPTKATYWIFVDAGWNGSS